jgi:hypothetical protein
MSNCGGKCGGSCGSRDDGWATPDDLIHRDSYDTLYERCQCGGLGLFPHLWDEFGPSITKADYLHFRKSTGADCVPRDRMPPGDAFFADQLVLR